MAEGLLMAGLERGKPDGSLSSFGAGCPSHEVFEEVSSIDVLPHSSGKGCHLFGLGDHLGTGLVRQLQVAVPQPGGSWQVRQMEVMEVIILTRHGKR